MSAGGAQERVREALEKAFYLGGGHANAIAVERGNGGMKPIATLNFDRGFNCSGCGAIFPEPTPALFSSNSPIGACPECEGFGRTVELDLEKVIPNPNLSIRQGLIAPWRTPAYREMPSGCSSARGEREFARRCLLREMSDEERAWLLDGEPQKEGEHWDERWPGVHGFFRWLEAPALQNARQSFAREIPPLRHLPHLRRHQA